MLSFETHFSARMTNQNLASVIRKKKLYLWKGLPPTAKNFHRKPHVLECYA